MRQLEVQENSGWWTWIPLVVFPTAVLVLTPDEWPRWAFMWLLAFGVFAGCKWLSWAATPAARSVATWRQAGYLLAWPGLDAKTFLRPSRLSRPERPLPGEWIHAVGMALIGFAVFWGVSRAVPPNLEVLRGWVGMVGIILMLHFGAFHLLSCVWRSIGIEAHPLMNSPLASVSVSEFWGRRWNTAFRDLTHRFLFLPLTRKIGYYALTLLFIGFTAIYGFTAPRPG